jgi:arylsulfatase A-like enzyme
MNSIRFNRLCRALLLPALLLGFSANAQSFVISNTAPKAIPRRASIILVVADGLGYGDLSCYGQTQFQTPNLDKLAAEGIRFTSYYAGAAAESPARAALMLGEDSGHLRQRAGVDISLAPDEITVAQMLRQSGYHTGLIGEWNLGDENSSGAPWKKGFDEFAGYFDANDAENFYADYMWRYAPRSIYNQTNGQMETFMGRESLMPNLGGAKGEYIPDLLTMAALNFIQINQPDAANRYRPFFLLLNYKIPGDGKSQVPTDAPFSEEKWPQPAKNKAAMIARLDGYISQLAEQLQKLGLTNNVAVFFTSDTGPKRASGIDLKLLNSAGYLRSGELYEGDLRVPMIVHWPGTIAAGSLNDVPVAAWDIAPTLLDIAFASTVTNFDGISLLPTLSGKPQLQPHEIFFRWELRGRETAQAARLGDWKVVRPNSTTKWELYHIKTDPNETENVADKYPAVIKSIEESWKDFQNTGRRLIWPAQISTNGIYNL